MKNYKNGEPCEHPGCLSHVTHPCEGCGRIQGIYSIPLKWTKDKPTILGLYLFKIDGQWPILQGFLVKGDWRDAQNPNELYLDGKYLKTIHGIFYGPIPKIPKQ